MAEIERFLGVGSRIQEIGFPTTDDTVPDTYAFQVDATPEKPLVLKLQVTGVTIRQPTVKFLQNPQVDGPGSYRCSFAATHRLIERAGEVCDRTSKHYGKLFGGFECIIHRGEPHLHHARPRGAVEDVSDEERVFSADFVRAPSGGLVSGFMVVNPGWEYMHAGFSRWRLTVPDFVANDWEEEVIPNLLPGQGAVLHDTTVIELKNTFSQQVPTPHGVWDFTHFGAPSESPRWWRASHNYRARSTTHHGEELQEGFSLCHAPLSMPPESRGFQILPYETKLRLFIEVSKP